MITIYHNNSCTKSRVALAALTKSGEDFEIVNYLEDVPSVATLKEIVAKLNIKPVELVRKTEKLYLEKYKKKELTGDECIMAMHEHPILIQRPIVISGKIAVIARSEEELDKII